MAEPIGPGDWVEKFAQAQRPLGPKLPIGTIRCVSEVLTQFGQTVINFHGAPTPQDIDPNERWQGWDPTQWRPVYRPKTDLIENLMKTPVSEDA